MELVSLDENTEKELTNYFKKEYDSNISFMFCHISYKVRYLEYGHQMMGFNHGRMKEEDQYVQKSDVAHIPTLVPKEMVDSYEDYIKLNSCLKVEKPIDVGSSRNFDTSGIISTLEKVLPEEIIMLDMNQLTKAMRDLGYEEFTFTFQNLGPSGDGRIVTRGTGYKKKQVESNLSITQGNYMDKQDQSIQEKMVREGKVKINQQFLEFVHNYYKRNYDLDGNFEFLPVEYQFFDENHMIYNLNEHRYVKRPEKREVKRDIPCFVTQSGYQHLGDLRSYRMVIPDVIKEESLLEEVAKRLPLGVMVIPTEKIEEILNQNGYEEPFFDHYFYSMMERPSFNIYARPLQKDLNSKQK